MDNKELVAGTILAWPRAETRAPFIAMGMDRDLTRATQIAVQNAIDFLAAYRGWSKMEAYRFVSVACDVRVTELVDGNVGVHVMIPKAIVGSPATSPRPGRGRH
jgi:acetamidase/formamidase